MSIGYYSQDCNPNKGLGSEQIERNDQLKNNVLKLEEESLSSSNKNTNKVLLVGALILLLILAFIFLNKK